MCKVVQWRRKFCFASDLEHHFATTLPTTTSKKADIGVRSIPTQTELIPDNIDNQFSEKLAATVAAAVPIDSLTCSINETINECGRACEISCGSVSLTLIIQLTIK